MNHDPENLNPDTPYIPSRKKETAKVWLLTIILHLLIGLSLLAYWHFYHKPKTQPLPTTNQPMASTPMKTNIIMASIVASTTFTSASATASTTKTSSTVASTPKIAKITQPLTTHAETAQNVKQNLNQNQPQNTKQQAIDMPQSTTTVTTTTQKVVHEAPVTQALTDRDLPMAEKPKNTIATSEQNKEATELSEDIDAKNKELSDLINQVKKQNQQKIDKEINQPFVPPVENKTEPKVEENTEAKTEEIAQ